MYYGLQCHPSYRTVHSLTNQIMMCSTIPGLHLHEVDGAYANERLNAHFLSIPGFTGSEGGFFLDHSRCQNHASHLITVAMLDLVGCNVLSKLYQLTVFLSNLGYVLRLQMAVRDWLLETMVFNPNCDLHSLPTDPLMEEVRDYIKMWHHSKKHEEIEDGGNPRVKQFDRRMEAFVGMWNGSPTGAPTHHCNCHLAGEGHRHCKDRQHAAEKMANVLIDLLLTSCPSPPAPNKWTKLWRPVDFVAVGILLNGYLPKIFDLAFQAMQFSATGNSAGDEDPRAVEKLYFHEVQGKRYLGAKTFLQDRQSQFAIRLLLVSLEPLRVLTNSWLNNLTSLKKGGRFPLHNLLDPRDSPVTFVLQKISGLLMDQDGGGRLRFLWGLSNNSYQSWCAIRPEEVRLTRQVLLALSALIHRRHVLYWLEFPWSLSVLGDPDAEKEFRAETLKRWDLANACCVRPGLARDLKKLGISSQHLQDDPFLGVWWHWNCFLFLL